MYPVKWITKTLNDLGANSNKSRLNTPDFSATFAYEQKKRVYHWIYKNIFNRDGTLSIGSLNAFEIQNELDSITSGKLHTLMPYLQYTAH